VLGIVGAGGIGGALYDAIRFQEYDQAGLALIVVIIGTIAVDTISGAIRKRIVAGRTVDLGDGGGGGERAEDPMMSVSPGAAVLAQEPGR
jgi:phosphonate transport system permease protein